MLLKYKNIYFELLLVYFPSSTFIGIITGLSSLRQIEHPMDKFINIIGYSTLGMVTGITYPISYPLLGAYVLYKTYK
jgi:hypothetical protein